MEPNVVIGSNLGWDVNTAPCGNPGLSDPDGPSSSNLVPCVVLTPGSCNYEPPPTPRGKGARDLNTDFDCSRATNPEMAPQSHLGLGVNMTLGVSSGHPIWMVPMAT